MKIVIETIDHKDQRYPTCGDYYIDCEGTIQVRVSKLDNEIQEFSIALHELVELMLCRQRGIKFEDIDAFDTKFEEDRNKCTKCQGKGCKWWALRSAECDGEGKSLITNDVSEPGDSPNSPYKLEHRFAENIERQFIHESGLNWAEYNKKIEEL